MAFYFFWQDEPKSRWIPALADERANIIREKKPALCTVLDVDSTFEDDMTADEHAAVKYRGPLYWDIDSGSIDEAIEQTKKLLTLIKSKGVDLNMLRCYLTGGRGFHVLMDPIVFMPKIPPSGVAHLPTIYREMVYSAAFVDDVDLRVYSTRKGRQLRCANYLRENGKYKVSATAEEILSLTPERYEALCASPRNDVPVEPPKFNPDFGLAYSVAFDKVTKGVAKKKTKKASGELLQRFGGEWPETFTLINNGLGIRPEIGFNQIAMQVAITGTLLGKTEEQILADCSGLIESHKGDSSRYSSPFKRRAFMREMIRYVDSNPLYEYSPGGVISLLLTELRANADVGFGEYIPDEPTPPLPAAPVDTTGMTPAEAEAATAAAPELVAPEDEETGPVRVARSGIFVRSEQGWVGTTDIGMANPIVLKKMDNTTIGYDLEVFLNNRPLGRHVLTMDKLASKAAMQSWTMNWSASMSASDNQTAKIADILRKKAEKTNATTYVVTREGIDLIVPPGAQSEDDFDVIWSAPDQVVTNGKLSYRFRSHLDKNGTFKSDLITAPELTVDDAELIHHLLHVNTTANLAKLLGWFSAAFLTQILRRFTGQFPSLQVFGQSGAGKSKTTSLLNHLHYHMKDPKEMMAQGQTQYPMIVAVASSASMPVVFEEVKSREMSKTLRDFLLNLFRNNYDGHAMARGALTKDQSTKDVTVNEFENSGPIVFVGEAVENQSAILERCIIVSLSKTDRYGKGEHYHYCSERRTEIGKLGRALMESTLAIDLKGVRSEFAKLRKSVAVSLGDKAEEMERPAFNIAVVLLGLQLLRDTLRRTFGNRFDERLQDMHDSLLGDVGANIPKNMAEASRVLDVLAQLSRNPDQNYHLQYGVDYTVSNDGKYVDLKMKQCYSKYVRYQRSLGYETLYDNDSAFITSMSNYGGCVARAVPDSILFDNPMACVYRISAEYMEKEEVETFSDKK